MNFTQLSFWLLAVPSILIFWILPRRSRALYLLTISLLFYSSWEVWYLIPLTFSTVIDFFVGSFIYRNIKDEVKKKIGLGLSIVNNIGLLCFFKVIKNSFEVIGADIHFGITSGEEFKNVVFPVGISFYTFQTMSYSWDIFRGRLKPEQSFIRFFLYVSFFPQLMAGPIERARRILPQLSNMSSSISRRDVEFGVLHILLGLFKKIFISSVLIEVLTKVRGQDAGFLIVGTLMTFVVFYDFSGYSDMARGLAKLFGVNIMINFKPFYFSKNPKEFWETWNRSLTSWIRDYLFFSLRSKSTFNIILQTYLFLILIGLWHDFAFHWLAFGLFHATAILLHRFARPYLKKVPVSVSYIMMLIFYSIAGSLHLNKSFSWLLNPLNISKVEWLPANVSAYLFTLFIPLFILERLQRRTDNYDFFISSSWKYKLLFTAVALSGIWFGSQLEQHGFIYFMF